MSKEQMPEESSWVAEHKVEVLAVSGMAVAISALATKRLHEWNKRRNANVQEAMLYSLYDESLSQEYPAAANDNS